jgi:anti-sigma factor RsiW
MKMPAGCAEQRELIVAYVLGVSDADGATGVEAHLTTCATCRAWADTLQHEEQELKEVFMSIAEVTDRRMIPAPGRSDRLRRAWWLPAAFAAAVLLVIGLWPGEHGAKRA